MMQGMDDPVFFPATAMPDPDWWHALWPDPKGTLGALGIGPGMTVLDLCCGDGYFTAPLIRLAAPGRVYALDMDPVMLAAARKLVESDGGDCTWIEGDAMALEALVPETVDFWNTLT